LAWLHADLQRTVYLHKWSLARVNCGSSAGKVYSTAEPRNQPTVINPVTFPTTEHPPLDQYQIILLGDRGTCVYVCDNNLLRVVRGNETAGSRAACDKHFNTCTAVCVCACCIRACCPASLQMVYRCRPSSNSSIKPLSAQ